MELLKKVISLTTISTELHCVFKRFHGARLALLTPNHLLVRHMDWHGVAHNYRLMISLTPVPFGSGLIFDKQQVLTPGRQELEDQRRDFTKINDLLSTQANV